MHRMKSLWVLFLLLALGCAKHDELFVRLSRTGSVEVEGRAQRVEIGVESNRAWGVDCSVPWCTIDQSASGFVAVLEANVGTTERSVDLMIRSQETVQTLTLTQAAWSDYAFQIPVIAHIIYADALDPNQYVRWGRVAELIAGANSYFAQWNIGVEWVLASHTPDGRLLSEPGVERVLWTDAYPINSDWFATGDQVNRTYSWDPNQYLNIYFYAFAEQSNTTAFSFVPFLPSSNVMEGFDAVDYARLELEDVKFLPGICFNNKYVYANDPGWLNDDATKTLTHEMGHYLGLSHVFDNDPDPTVCRDTDYCVDTKSYNRAAYESYLGDLLAAQGKATEDQVVWRTSGSGEKFKSDNLMDYFFSWNNRFTPDQKKRMRHVLGYGLLIPGPKAIDMPVSRTEGRPTERLKGARTE